MTLVLSGRRSSRADARQRSRLDVDGDSRRPFDAAVYSAASTSSAAAVHTVTFLPSFTSLPLNDRNSVQAKFYHAILVADRSEDGRRPAASWNLAYHLAH